jgi:hypothetical protein
MIKKEYITPIAEVFDFETEHIASLSTTLKKEGGHEESLSNKRQENWPQKQGWSNPAPWEE